MKHTKTGNTYIIKVERGENVINTLTDFCKAEGIENGYMRGIGAVEWVSCGYYELDIKEYHFTEYDEMVEVVSMTGNVALKEGEPFLHVHALFTNTKNEAFGGHVAEMRVGVVLEVVLEALPTKIERELDDEIGLYLMSCGS